MGAACVEKDVRPVKHLETQLNYFFEPVCSRLQKRGWLVKGVGYISGDYLRWV